MTPPVTGNGMSMAVESAALALGPLAAYSRAELTWMSANEEISGACDLAFAARLRRAQWLHWMMCSPLWPLTAKRLALKPDWLWRMFLSATR